MRRTEVVDTIRRSGVVGIIRARTETDGEAAARSLLGAGLPVIEVSLTTPGAIDIVGRLSAAGAACIGVGTVLTVDDVQAAESAGARFVVSPVFRPDVIREAKRLDLATLPGVGTATEALAAIESGADFAKLFPASALGPGAVRDLLTALPWLPLVPTGGISLEEVPDYIAAGSIAVGMGSALTRGRPEDVATRVEQLLAAVRTARTTL